MSCVYLQPKTDKQTRDKRDVYRCHIHEQCVITGEPNPYASCESCKEKITLNDKKLSTDFKDPLDVFDREGRKTHSLRNLLAGRPAFLVCGGPSAKSLPLEKLKQRGVWSLAVNNMAGAVWTNAFICADPPLKFHHGIWLDPTVMKFVPTPKMRGSRNRLKEKVGEEFKPLKIDGEDVTVPDCPNVWAFHRRGWLVPDHTFFTEPHAAWGNHNEGVNRTGLKKTVNTFFLALRVLYYLGARTIWLVGTDWKMAPTAGETENYAFPQRRDQSAIQSNNDQYRIAGEWLEEMQKNQTFSRFGLSIFNCNPMSSLRAFEHVPFEEALRETLKNFPTEPFDLQDWYEKK